MKLGTVTGRDLARMNHRHLPRWLELSVYAVAEVTCISTETSQVIGTAFAWHLLIPKLPLDAALFLTLFDALLILLLPGHLNMHWYFVFHRQRQKRRRIDLEIG